MEDSNMLVGDCIVMCCCSQCLILQIVIFVLLKLPCKLIRKTKEYVKKKLGLGRGQRQGQGRRKEGKMMIERVDEEGVQLHTKSSMTMRNNSIEMELTQVGFGGVGFQCCMQEAEKVLEELSHKGEFAFGSFWGRSDSQTSGIISSSSSSSSSSSCLLANERFDFVHFYELVDIASFISAASLHHLMVA